MSLAANQKADKQRRKGGVSMDKKKEGKQYVKAYRVMPASWNCLKKAIEL